MAISIKPARTKSEIRKFIKSQWKFYKNHDNWVPPVIADRMKLFDTEKNPFYNHAEIELFIAYRDDEIVGRIAAIENRRHNEIHNDKVGFFGFFECIDDQDVANELFESAAYWLKERDLDLMRGPANPSFNDEVGLLVKGFDYPQVVLLPYNPPYYENLVLGAGLYKAKDLYGYHLENHKFVSDKLKRMQKIIRERYNVTIREVNFKDTEQYEKDVETLKSIYNKAWEPNWGFVRMTDEEFDYLAADLKQFAEQSLTYIAEVNGKPAGFALGLPDINQVLKYNRNGSMLGAVWHLLTKRKKIDWLRIIVLGVMPEYQGKGIDSVMYWEMGKRGEKIGIYDGDASWVLEDNVMMNRGLTTIMYAEHYKTFRIYEKEI